MVGLHGKLTILSLSQAQSAYLTSSWPLLLLLMAGSLANYRPNRTMIYEFLPPLLQVLAISALCLAIYRSNLTSVSEWALDESATRDEWMKVLESETVSNRTHLHTVVHRPKLAIWATCI